MTIMDALRKVKPALASSDVVIEFKHFLIKDGFIYAQDGRITAAAPIDFTVDKEFLIPANEFEKSVALFEGVGKDINVKVTDKTLLLSTDAHKARIKILDPSTFKIIEFEGDAGYAVKDDFLRALRICRPFISDNATQLWAAGIYIDGARMYATNNVSLISADISDFNFKGMLPIWTVDFILSRKEKLTHISGTENALKVEWEDGSWLRSTLIAAQFPGAGLAMLDSLTAASFTIQPAWKRAYQECIIFSDEQIHLYADKMLAVKDTMEFETSEGSPVGENIEFTNWNPKFLTPVVSVATAIDFDQYPKPAIFSGPGFRGLISGRR